MPKAKIVSHIADAEYNVIVYHDDGRIAALIKQADAYIGELQKGLTAASSNVTDKQNALDSILAEIDALIGAKEVTEETLPEFQAKIADANAARVELWGAAYNEAIIKAEIESYKKKKALYQKIALNEEESTTAWACWLADTPTGQTPDVGHDNVIPNNTEVTVAQNGMMANAETPHVYTIVDDLYQEDKGGALIDPAAMSPGSTFVNASFIPAKEKYAPVYRFASIVSVDYENHTCDVVLDNIHAFSALMATSAVTANLQTTANAELNQTGIHIYYMDCDSWAFEEGDHVVVYYRNRTSPGEVIGFVDNPQPCRVPGGWQFYDWDANQYFAILFNETTEAFYKSTAAPQVGTAAWVNNAGTEYVSVCFPGSGGTNYCMAQATDAWPYAGRVIRNGTMLPSLPTLDGYSLRARKAGVDSNGDVQAMAGYSYRGAFSADDRSNIGWYTYSSGSWSKQWDYGQQSGNFLLLCLWLSSCYLNDAATSFESVIQTATSEKKKITATSSGYSLSAAVDDWAADTNTNLYGIGNYSYTCTSNLVTVEPNVANDGDGSKLDASGSGTASSKGFDGPFSCPSGGSNNDLQYGTWAKAATSQNGWRFGTGKQTLESQANFHYWENCPSPLCEDEYSQTEGGFWRQTTTVAREFQPDLVFVQIENSDFDGGSKTFKLQLKGSADNFYPPEWQVATDGYGCSRMNDIRQNRCDASYFVEVGGSDFLFVYASGKLHKSATVGSLVTFVKSTDFPLGYYFHGPFDVSLISSTPSTEKFYVINSIPKVAT